MPIEPVEKVWMNGSLVDWDDANVHVLTHALHYGSGVFEGVRCYDTPKGPAVFRLAEKEDVDQRESRVSEFLESIGHTSLDGLSVEEVHAQARTRGLNPRTLSLIEDLLEGVS